MIKLVASDLDETLLDLGVLSNYSKEVLDRLLAQGISFVPITARCYNEVDSWLTEHPEIHYCGCSNGAVIIDNHTKELLVSNELDGELVGHILDTVSVLNPWWTIVIAGNMYSSIKILSDKAYLNLEDTECERLVSSRIFVDDYHELLQQGAKVSKLHFVTIDPKDKAALKARLLIFSSQCTIASSHIENIEVSHSSASKGQVIAYLIRKMKLKTEEVIAFGDNDNDVSMFHVAKFGVAVSSGTPQLLTIASDKCAPATEHGVAKYIEKHLLNK